MLITSLTRRSFQNGKLEDNLGPWAEATKKVAREEGIAVLDLNADSFAAVQKMGPMQANLLATAPPPPSVAETAASGTSIPAPKEEGVSNPFDYTHLGEKGPALFGRMVADELVQAIPEPMEMPPARPSKAFCWARVNCNESCSKIIPSNPP